MNLESIYHRPKEYWAFVTEEGKVSIRIRSKKGEMHRVILHGKDPYSNGDFGWRESVSMDWKGKDQHYDYWEGVLSPKYRRLEYFFEFQSAVSTIFYSENGFSQEFHTTSGPFKYPYVHKQDVFDIPDWVNNTVWYQIFPERFRNGNPLISPDDIESWGNTPTSTNYFGGDIQGIMDRLDYLVDMGISGLYLTPIFTAGSNHKYDTIDYFNIDPHFGDKAVFKRFIAGCHQKGIRVMLDAVFNHCGVLFPYFQDVLQNGASSPYYEWFCMDECLPFGYETFAFTPTMPKLNTSHPEVKKYLLNVATYWIKEFNIDGWRLDVANEVDHAFWREFRAVVKEVKNDVYILGEVWNDAGPWLKGDQFDGAMNYPLSSAALDYLGTHSITKEHFIERIYRMQFEHPSTVQRGMFNILGSHDTPRLMNQANFERYRVENLLVFLFCYSGTPCLYYGDEIGMTGDQDPGCRKCMNWNEGDWDADLRDLVKRLTKIRMDYPSLRKGHIHFLEGLNGLVFEKVLGGEKLRISINAKGGALDKRIYGKRLIEGPTYTIDIYNEN